MKSLFVEIEKCLGCKSCELACAVEHSQSHSLYSIVNVPRISVEWATVGPFPLRCRHCDDPPCVDACISGALKQDKSKGIVFSNENRCIGCFMCMMVCPFGAIIPPFHARHSEPHASHSERSEESPATIKKVAYKCDLCKDREEPACVSACPTGALVYYRPVNLLRNKRLQIAKNRRK